MSTLLSLLSFNGMSAVKARKRLGRGPSSGTGKTCGRGHKGQKSRAGARGLFMLEGGQTPIYRRLPKRGFKSYNQQFGFEVVSLNFYQLESMINSGKLTKNITKEDLMNVGFLKEKKETVKLLSNGTPTISGVEIEVDLASESALIKAKSVGMNVKILGSKNN